MKRILEKAFQYIMDRDYRFYINTTIGIYNSMDDRKFLERAFKHYIGKELNLDNPQTFNEKLQWLKLYDRKPEYTTMVDKYRVRKYIAEKLGEEYLIPLLGVWDDPEEIDFDKLPNQFVLKCNHNSGLGMCICKDKTKLDIKKVKKDLRKGLKQDYYLTGREWPYKNVPRRVIAEKYMVDESGTELKDYKVFNYNGEPRLIEVDYGRFTKHMRNLYSTDWDYIEGEIEFPTDQAHSIPRPEKLEEMLELSRKLSVGIPHVRTDFYSINGRIYFGEMTFYHGSGMEHFRPEELGEKLGNWIILPQIQGVFPEM